MTEEERKQQDQFWPKFNVQCDECKSYDIIMDNDIGWSETSGSWGGLHFHCNNCKNRTTVAGSGMFGGD